ncbi:MAG: peptide-methionine (R)-S-oxide reductase MsrB [Hyphomicrobium sp.]|jgi:peptide-methionine (R)-S-oxide reductase
MLTRRAFHIVGLGFASLAATRSAQAGESQEFEIMKSDEDWKKLLTRAQYNVLRQHGTEPPGSSPLDKFYKPGTYNCAACDLPLYSSDAKFDSGTGWPSFFQPIDNAIGTSTDWNLIYSRTEVHCRRCGGHLGHVFDDGPPPTGKRYCMNGIAMKFVPKEKEGA